MIKLLSKSTDKMKNNLIQIFIVILLSILLITGMLALISHLTGINLITIENQQQTTDNLKPDNINEKFDAKLVVNELESNQPEVFIRMIANKPARLTSSKNQSIVYEEIFDNEYRYVVSISNLGIGENIRKITLEAYDKEIFEKLTIDEQSINYSELSIKVFRKNTSNWSSRMPGRHKNSTFVFDGDSLTANVSKTRGLPSDYAPSDLVDLNVDKLLYTNTSNILLRAEAADALQIMLNALKRDTGLDIVIASGYRSYINQEETYAQWLRQLGQEEADKISARPGYSEHQLGTTVDFFSAESGFEYTERFDESRAGKWLRANSYKFGFVQSYPKGAEDLTGYSHEAWHYRYIGIENATNFQAQSLSLNQYLNSLLEKKL